MMCWTKKSLPFSIFSCCLIKWPLVPVVLQKFCIFIILDIFTMLPFWSSLLQVEGHYLFKLLYRKLLWLFSFPLSIPFMLSWHWCWFDQSITMTVDWLTISYFNSSKSTVWIASIVTEFLWYWFALKSLTLQFGSLQRLILCKEWPQCERLPPHLQREPVQIIHLAVP